MPLPRVSGTIAAISGLLLSAQVAFAGSTIWTAPSSCNTLNCNATILHANITSSLSNPGGSVEPFIIQVHSSPQYCLRLDVLNATTAGGTPVDVEMVLVSPDGSVWRNNNRSPSDLRPLIVVPRGPAQGWYTVHLSTAGGRILPAGSHLNADLAYGRYTSTTNVNCRPFTNQLLPGPGNS
ncbi:MAG TPA: hypothetical protein VFQ82_11795 [Stellaceae bacterium]|jgi:hypothetical protein|nr:hypothetical protein [Stellaceae bacterium]